MNDRAAIVCVDDEPLVLKALQRELRKRLGRRYAIETAGNGAEALELIDQLEREQTEIQLVVSDAMMPVMDGYELIERLHTDRPHLSTIMITGYGNEAKLKQLTEDSGLLAIFDKPWDPERLCSFIETTLAGAAS